HHPCGVIIAAARCYGPSAIGTQFGCGRIRGGLSGDEEFLGDVAELPDIEGAQQQQRLSRYGRLARQIRHMQQLPVERDAAVTLGVECDRGVTLGFRWAAKPAARTLRTTVRRGTPPRVTRRRVSRRVRATGTARTRHPGACTWRRRAGRWRPAAATAFRRGTRRGIAGGSG